MRGRVYRIRSGNRLREKQELELVGLLSGAGGMFYLGAMLSFICND